MNREPSSTHLELINKHRFEIVNIIRTFDESNSIKRNKLYEKFKGITDEDLKTTNTIIIAKKQ